MSKVYHPSHYNIAGRKECWDEMVERDGIEQQKIQLQKIRLNGQR